MALLIAPHPRLGPDRVADWDVPFHPEAVAGIRRAAAQLDRVGPVRPGVHRRAGPLSELVTNAIRYGAPPVHVRPIHDRVLTCEVSDTSSTSPHLPVRGHRPTSGRVAVPRGAARRVRWGTRYTGQGKVIWRSSSSRAPGTARGQPARGLRPAGRLRRGPAVTARAATLRARAADALPSQPCPRLKARPCGSSPPVGALSSVEHGYDLLAPKFDVTPSDAAAVLESVADVLRPSGLFGAGLDLCCGTGAGTGLLRELCRERVTGVDVSAGMLAQRPGRPLAGRRGGGGGRGGSGGRESRGGQGAWGAAVGRESRGRPARSGCGPMRGAAVPCGVRPGGELRRVRALPAAERPGRSPASTRRCGPAAGSRSRVRGAAARRLPSAY